MAGQLICQLILLAILCCQKNVEARSMQIERIVNGFNATAKQFPYQVFFDIHSNFEWNSNCGGVIISERHILTAAHCVEDEFLAIKIYFGAVDKSNKKEKGQQRLIVDRKNIVMHEEYDKDQNLNDIALIKLPADLQFDEYIQPAKLPDPEEVYDDKLGVVSGWGVINVHVDVPKKYTNVLQYYDINILSNEKCRKTPFVKKNVEFFPSSWVCLEPSASSVCQGDSGGPLAIRNDDGSSTLVGITSFGDGSCRTNGPDVYTRVSSFLPWIRWTIISLQ